MLSSSRSRALFIRAKPRFFSSKNQGPKTQILRDFMQDALYSPTQGYFNTDPLIFTAGVDKTSDQHHHRHLINFNRLSGQDDYVQQLRTLYSQSPRSWTTPTEIFKPWYGRAIARRILEKRRFHKKPLRIYEVGGGNGTLCLNILDYIRDISLPDYLNAEYHIIEISDTFHKRQANNVAQHRHGIHKEHVMLHHCSFFDWKSVVDEECFVLAMEVFDNLPHDRILVKPTGEILETAVETTPGSPSPTYREFTRPARDPTVIRYLGLLYGPLDATHSLSGREKLSLVGESSQGLFQSHFDSDEDSRDVKLAAIGEKIWRSGSLLSSLALKKDRIMFLPTAGLKFLDQLRTYFRKHHLILADFNYLPDIVIPGENACAVQSKEFKRKRTVKAQVSSGPNSATSSTSTKEIVEYKTTNHKSYLESVGNADIFFPTNFWDLKYVYGRTMGPMKQTAILSNGAFMKRYAELQHTRTVSGFNPLLTDYKNMWFFVANNMG